MVWALRVVATLWVLMNGFAGVKAYSSYVRWCNYGSQTGETEEKVKSSE